MIAAGALFFAFTFDFATQNHRSDPIEISAEVHEDADAYSEPSEERWSDVRLEPERKAHV